VGHNSNPFNVPIEVRYRFSDVGPRQITNTTDATRFVAGLNGSWRDWSWEAAGGYTRSESEQKDRNNIRISGLLAAIADGSYNFVNNAANTPEVYDRIRVGYSRFGDSKLSFVDAKVSGELMQMRSGPLAMAAGIEFRKEDYDDISDPVLTSGDVLGRGSTQAKGARDITSAYIEFSVPIVKTVEMQLAGRTDRYSDYGRSTTPKLGLRWAADPSLLVRATYAKGFRAPSIPESGESSAFFFQSLEDSTRCAINAVYCGATSLPGSFSANPDLKPEKSDSWTGGFVWEPVRGTSIGIDYYYVKQKDLISSRDFQFILDNESRYSQFVTRGPATSDDIARGAPGPIVIVAVPYENLSSLKTSGIDVDARVRWAAGEFGRMSAGFMGSYLISYKQPPAPEEPLEELAGTYDVPRIKAVLNFGHDMGPFSTNIAFNYTHHFKQSTSASATAAENISSLTTMDAQVAYSGIKNLKLFIGGRNLGDRQPPVAIAEISTVYLFEQHSLRGRYWYAGLNYNFR
jgi:iron complex outermembrane receptor protein